MEEHRKEEDLIQFVSEKPFLYDKKNPAYKDTTRKLNAFQEIAERLQIAGAKEAKDLWEKLRKQYTNYLSKLKHPSGSGATNLPFFRHAGAMNFYQAVYKPYKLNSNIDEEVERDEEGNENEATVSDDRQTGNIEVNYEGFEDDESPPQVLVDTPNRRAASTPHVPRSRSKKRVNDHDDFSERFFMELQRNNSENQGDEFDHLGGNIAARVRKLSVKKPRLGTELQLELQKKLAEFELLALQEESQPH